MFQVFRNYLNTGKGVQGTLNTKYGRSVFGEKERPTLKQSAPYVQGIWSLPENDLVCTVGSHGWFVYSAGLQSCFTLNLPIYCFVHGYLIGIFSPT